MLVLRSLAGQRSLFVADLIATVVALVIGLALSFARFDAAILNDRSTGLIWVLSAFVPYAAGVLYFSRLYGDPARDPSLIEFRDILRVSTALALSLLVLDYVLAAPNRQGFFLFGRITIALYFVLQVSLLVAVRGAWRYRTRLAGKILPIIDLCFIVLASSLLLGYVAHISLREPDAVGAIGIFLLLTSSIVAVIFSNRLLIGTMIFVLLMLSALDLADWIKYQLIWQHVGFSDLLLLASMSLPGFRALVAQYAPYFADWLVAGVAVLAVLLLVIVFEIACSSRRRVSFRWKEFFVAASVAMTIGVGLLAMPFAVATKEYFYEVTERGPLRYSSLISGLRVYMNLSADYVVASRRGQPAELAGSCAKCPDIVIFHAESVFDPIMAKEFSTTPGLMERLDEKRRGNNGFLLVNIKGGGSYISEFELLCGVNHGVFGRASRTAPVVVSHFAVRCLPQYLKSIGYETTAIYSTRGMWLNMRGVLRNYGFDTVLDTKDLNIPGEIAFAVRDEVFTNKLMELLSRPRERPRLIFVSTNWNHGPHGSHILKALNLDRPILRERFAGPFSVERASSPQLQDYINRLNDTYSNLERVEEKILRQPFPVAMLSYGDHQPSFDIDFTETIVKEYGSRTAYVTFYRMLSNLPQTVSRKAKMSLLETPSIEAVLPRLLKWLDMPLSPTMTAIDRIAESCGRYQSLCSDERSQDLRRLIMQ